MLLSLSAWGQAVSERSHQSATQADIDKRINRTLTPQKTKKRPYIGEESTYQAPRNSRPTYRDSRTEAGYLPSSPSTSGHRDGIRTLQDFNRDLNRQFLGAPK